VGRRTVRAATSSFLAGLKSRNLVLAPKLSPPLSVRLDMLNGETKVQATVLRPLRLPTKVRLQVGQCRVTSKPRPRCRRYGYVAAERRVQLQALELREHFITNLESGVMDRRS
jgi:hypothetical protein